MPILRCPAQHKGVQCVLPETPEHKHQGWDHLVLVTWSDPPPAPSHEDVLAIAYALTDMLGAAGRILNIDGEAAARWWWAQSEIDREMMRRSVRAQAHEPVSLGPSREHPKDDPAFDVGSEQ